MSSMLAVALTSALWAADVVSGTWVLNLEKSQPGGPTKSHVMTIKVEGDKETTTSVLTMPDGKEERSTVTFLTDGKEHPASEVGMGKLFETYVVRRVHEHESIYEFSKAGKVVHSVTTTFSKDGKTKTAVMKNTFPNGKTSESRLLFDRR